MKLCVFKLVLSFVLLLGLSRPLYAKDAWSLTIHTDPKEPCRCDLFFSRREYIASITFNAVNEMEEFINILREQDFGSHVGHMEVTLPNENIKLYGPDAEGFDYTVPTVFGDLTIQTVAVDGDKAATHKILQVSYSGGL